MSDAGNVRIVADIGGTNARFATVGASARALERVDVLTCADYPTIEEAFQAYERQHALPAVDAACIAVAGPVGQDVVELPNSHWRFSKRALAAAIGAPLEVINDFTAQALCIDLLRDEELAWIGDPRPRAGGPRAIIGPGTGLGVAVQGEGGEVLPSEGGHAGFAPADAHQILLLEQLLRQYERVSVERCVSGPGLENLYRANAQVRGADVTPARAPEIARLAAAGDELALAAIADFFAILASFAGDVALTVLSTGGVYLSGGVLNRLLPFFDPVNFRARFENKGRFRSFCASIAIARVTAEQPGLLGCSAWLARSPRST